MTVGNLKDHALALGQAHYHVVPLPPGMKAAPPEGWPTLASVDQAVISQWWTDQPNANIAVVGGHGLLIVDVDTRKGGDASIQALEAKHGPLPATLTARTPSGGRHLYFLGPDVSNSAGKIGAGLDIRSRNGYVVAPPSHTVAIAGKQSEGQYQWVEPILAPAAAPQWLIDLAGAPKVAAATSPGATTAFQLKCIDAAALADLTAALNFLLTRPEVAGYGPWSEIGLALLSLGDEGRGIWCEWSSRAPGYGGADTPDSFWDRNSGKAARTDYRHIFTVAARYGWANPGSRAAAAALPVPLGTTPAQGPRFMPVDAWEYADGPDPRWRVQGMLPEQGLAMIFGASGAGKTFFVLDLVMAIARGIPYGFDKRTVVQGRVVYVVAEGAGGFRKRLRAYRLHHRLQPGSPAPRLVTIAPNLMNAPDVQALLEGIVTTGGADVVVIDTLHASTAGADENSAKDMGALLGHCRALQASTGGLVILIHHSGKDEERGARGSSALRAAVDTEIEVSSGGEDCSVARVTKQRDGDTDGSACFSLVNVLGAGSAVVQHQQRPAKGDARRGKTSDVQTLAINLVRTMGAAEPSRAVQLEVLVAAVKRERPDIDRPDSIKRSITNAINKGLLRIDSGENVRLPGIGGTDFGKAPVPAVKP